MLSNSVEETVKAGRELGGKLKNDDAVLLYGEMGAGKTHFVKGMALGLGVTATITSPTFALVNEYKGLYHFDLFRINSLDDLYAIGFCDYIGKGVLAVEWSENIPNLERELDDYYKVKIAKKGENAREITIDYTRT
ncbi:MAG: tRNA (adenosine(37)-N6)-threonylcarbamoyltransferase complex ATPase subunit type 1 TsaE [Oscillospiraceae bacterium]|jgi:tRNA threonylcarbamoyladenosine biosynthesis protein TsaE|nr:tRNA (adenosine(37)-N6)-threonylcarbamoyltransferase complex ATPase subunit type 1 TsaE [Oscillospiraceae bacterium]